jgi:hypothetical protein
MVEAPGVDPLPLAAVEFGVTLATSGNAIKSGISCERGFSMIAGALGDLVRRELDDCVRAAKFQRWMLAVSISVIFMKDYMREVSRI